MDYFSGTAVVAFLAVVAVAATILIGTIVNQASVSGFARHVGAFVRPAIVGVVGLEPRIEVTDVSVKRENALAVSHVVDLLRRKNVAFYVDGQRQFSAGEHCDQFSFWRIRAALNPKRTTYCYLVGIADRVADDGETDIISGGRTVILSDNLEMHLVRDAKAFNISGHYTDISAQLALFGILHNAHFITGGLPLPTRPISSDRGSAQCAKNHQSNKDFKSPFGSAFFLINMMLMAFGVWLAVFRSFRHIGWLPIGFFLIVIGWCSIAFARHVLPLAENVSAALGIDASAACYGRSENVRVFPVVVPELELGNVERHIFFC